MAALAGPATSPGSCAHTPACGIGQVALVAPLVSTEGAIAALIALLAGETLAPGVIATLGLLDRRASRSPRCRTAPPRPTRRPGTTSPRSRSPPAARSASARACTRRAAPARVLPSAWVVLSARLIGAVVLALPLALAGRLRLSRRSRPFSWSSPASARWPASSAFTAGARHGIAVAAVLSSQWATVAAVGAYVAVPRAARTAPADRRRRGRSSASRCSARCGPSRGAAT